MKIDATTRRTIGIAAVAAVLIGVVWYLALYRPQSAHLASAHQAYATTEAQVASLHQQLVSLEALERQVPADRARLQTLDAAVPDTPDLHDVLRQLNTLAGSAGVELTTVAPSATASPSSASATPGSGLQTIQISMGATGSYAALTAFMSGLTQMPRTVVIDSVAITPAGADLSANLDTEIFYAP